MQHKKIKSVDEFKKIYWEKMARYTTATPSPLPYKPRWINWLYACFNAYFWLPCPLCGKKFGGHEWYASIDNGCGGGRGVCPECSLANYNKTESLTTMRQ